MRRVPLPKVVTNSAAKAARNQKGLIDMRYLHGTGVGELLPTSYSVRRRETLDFEAVGGERYFEHDVEARPLARIYQFPVNAMSRFALRLQRKA